MAIEVDGKPMMAAAIPLGNFMLSYTAPLGLIAGNRPVDIAVPGVKAGDVVTCRPTSAIAIGYDIGSAYCVNDGTVSVIVHYPALTLGQTFNLNVRIFRIDK